MKIRIEEVKRDKKRFMPLLLLADEQESMIDRYLDRGAMFVLIDDELASISRKDSKDETLSPASESPASTPINEDSMPTPTSEGPASISASKIPGIISPNATLAYSRMVAECAAPAPSRIVAEYGTPAPPRVVAECVVTNEGNDILEIKNIATDPELQGRGYGRALIDFLARKFSGHFKILQVGTGDSPLTVPFYERCGFTRSHRIANFFTDNYDHPIIEAGVQLVDMVYLRRSI